MIDVSALIMPGIPDPVTRLCISRARRYSQFVKMAKTALEGGKCPFCDPQPPYNNVIQDVSNEFWLAWQSSSPEQNTEHHFIIVPKRHISDSSDLTEPEQLALFVIMNALKAKYGLTSRGWLLRDGDARVGSGTIEHLHFHLMTTNGKGRVESPFWKGDEADAKSLSQALVFNKIFQGTKFEDLPAEEQTLVKDKMD